MRGAMLLLLGTASAFCPGGSIDEHLGQSVSPEHSAAQWPLLDHHTIETAAPPPPPPAYKCLVDPPPGTKPCQSCDPSDPGAMTLDKCYQTCDPPAIPPRSAWPRIPMTSAGVH